MELFSTQIESAKVAFSRLTKREQVIVAVGALVGGLIVLGGIGFTVSSAITRAELRVQSKTEALSEILAKEGEYKARKQEHEARKRSLKGQANVRLVKIVEDAARAAGVQIGQLSPEEGEPNQEGIIESRVDLRAQELSIDRLQDFLTRLESSPGLVIVRRLKISKPYRKETLTVDLTVTTFKLKG